MTEKHEGWHDDCSSGLHEYCSECQCPCHGFNMTRQEVIYFLENIKNEYLKKETYAESLNLIKRMEAFLESTV